MGNTSPPANLAKAEESTFRLLDLPPELWARVVREAVTRDIEPWNPVDDPIDFGIPPIAKTCRAVRSEALQSYYKYNVFCIHGSCDFAQQVVASCHEWIERMMKAGYWNFVQPVLFSVCCFRDEDSVTRVFKEHCPNKSVEVSRVGDVVDQWHVRVEETTAIDGNDAEGHREGDEKAVKRGH